MYYVRNRSEEKMDTFLYKRGGGKKGDPRFPPREKRRTLADR